MMKSITLSILLTFAATVPSYATAQGLSETDNLGSEIFSECKFHSTFNSELIKFKSKSDGDQDGCTISFSPLGFKPAGGKKIVLLITRRKNTEKKGEEAGFRQVRPNDWSFIGYPFANPPYKFQDLGLEMKQKNGDLTLVGHETVSATSQVGSTITFDGISVFRMSSNFLVSVQLPLELDTQDTIRKSVRNDLIETVDSIQIDQADAASNR
jgi:hypothetical protein